ncbi:protein of unknown function [Taphrina deformans PYCC 5710]|uniref:DOT1 domain-containing protein n=1 Tax=Taphrina deformans (strain PYCC 5710 / ATCC 11124 / CBS 356.35 / IMI 108563 / JCM 9778 / NBRC 8474) TaxID=1097556 RepID=R4XGL5_TAPDE|nr:protein of unknown function [Taphrina deformans PYCC 5710]|eukprot:CCG82509.1 protein of unknown function [Taphrina deformans PYCC 5710]
MAKVLVTREARMSSRSSALNHTKIGTTFLDIDTTMPTNSEDLYRRINKVERGIGGDAGVIGMSGSVARLDLDKILSVMALDSKSHFLDIGSGLGRPMLHALQFGAAQASGIEFDSIKHCKSQTVIDRVLPVEQQIKTCVHHGDVLALGSLNDLGCDISHIFSFWEGINIDAREAVGRLVAKNWQKSKTVTTVAFVQSHVEHLQSYMKELYFPAQLKLVDTFPITMIGSAAKFRAYIFKFPAPRPIKTDYVRRSTRCTGVDKTGLSMSLSFEERYVSEIASSSGCESLSEIPQKPQSLPRSEASFPIRPVPDETLLGNSIVRKRKLRSASHTAETCTAVVRSQNLESTIVPSSASHITTPAEPHADTQNKPVIRKTPSRAPKSSLTEKPASSSLTTSTLNSPIAALVHTANSTRSSSVVTDLSSDLIDLGTANDQDCLTPPLRLSMFKNFIQPSEVINISPGELCLEPCEEFEHMGTSPPDDGHLLEVSSSRPINMTLDKSGDGKITSDPSVMEPRATRILRSGTISSPIVERGKRRCSGVNVGKTLSAPGARHNNKACPRSDVLNCAFAEEKSIHHPSVDSMTGTHIQQSSSADPVVESSVNVSMGGILEAGEVVLGDYVIEPRRIRTLRSARTPSTTLSTRSPRQSFNRPLTTPRKSAEDREISPQTSTDQCMTPTASEAVRSEMIWSLYGDV